MKTLLTKFSAPLMGCCLLLLTGQAFAADIVGTVQLLVVGTTGSDEILVTVSNPTTGASLDCADQVSDPNFTAYVAMLTDAYDSGKPIEMICSNSSITYLRHWVGNGS